MHIFAKHYAVFIIAFLPFLGLAQNNTNKVIARFQPKAVEIKSPAGFIHPGIGLNTADLNRIQKMVRLGYEPWASAFNRFRADPKTSKDYIIQNIGKNGKPKYEEMADGNGQYEARRDADAAYAQTLMWYITGDTDYAKKALQIIRSWYTSTQRKTNDMLTAGMAMQKFCFAAEVLRYTPASGWLDKDTEGFTGFLQIMQPSTNRPTAFMNQGSIATMGLISIAVFTDDKIAYAKAVTRATTGTESEAPNRDYSLKNQIREVKDSTTGKPVIILVEMGRDQGHAQGDVGALGSIARTAYIQGTQVNAAGDIVDADSGTNLFGFMSKRLLTGAAMVAKYNLGYDVVYPPANVGTAAKPEIYNKASNEGRGSLAAVYELIYNHYRYNENMPDSNSALQYIKQVKLFKGIEGSSQDFFGYGTLLYTPEKDIQNPGKPKGPPQVMALKDYKTMAKKLGRIQAADFTGANGDKTGNIGVEDYTDIEGTRPVMSGVKTNFYAWYKDVDFGTVPVDKMLVRAGSSSTHGCKIDLILLDKIAGIDYDKVTPADLKAGEKIATIQTTGTGWWTNFVTVKAALDKKLSGKHTFALQFYDSDNVYRFQADVDWFKFVKTYENEPDLHPKQEFLPITPGQISIVYKGKARLSKSFASVQSNLKGTTLVFPFVEFRNGPQSIAFRVKSNGVSDVSVFTVSKKSGLNDPPYATAKIENTGGKWATVYAKLNPGKKITGAQMLYITFVGKPANVDFKEMQFNPLPKP